MALVEKMRDERPKQFLLNLYMRGLQKDIVRQVAISQLTSLSTTIQWAKHVDMVTGTYNGASPSKLTGGSSSSCNHGGCGGGHNFGWQGGKGGCINGGWSSRQ